MNNKRIVLMSLKEKPYEKILFGYGGEEGITRNIKMPNNRKVLTNKVYKCKLSITEKVYTYKPFPFKNKGGLLWSI